MRAEVLAGLARVHKTLPCKLFYDRRGSELFERICELPEYYLTRTELQIMALALAAIAERLGPRVRLVEFGSGSSRKTRLLLAQLDQPTVYVPVDIAGSALAAAVATLQALFPRLPMVPLCADYLAEFALPPAPPGTARTVCYFPGSTVGNLTAAEAVAFLRRVHAIVGAGGRMLIGVDLRKDIGLLLPAYNDAAGVTAAFNINLLRRVNDELGADFDLDGFEHRAVWNGSDGRIEMQLISRRRQIVRIAGITVPFGAGEVVTTEFSHKYTLAGFAELATSAGFAVAEVWTDSQQWFSVQLLQPRS